MGKRFPNFVDAYDHLSDVVHPNGLGAIVCFAEIGDGVVTFGDKPGKAEGPNLYHWYHALALYSGREYERAVKALMEARSLDRWSYGLLAACYAQMGRLGDARSEAEAFVRERSRELNENGEHS